jgi:hypothetical protein
MEPGHVTVGAEKLVGAGQEYSNEDSDGADTPKKSLFHSLMYEVIVCVVWL